MTFDLISFGLGFLFCAVLYGAALVVLIIRGSSDNVSPWDVE